MFRKIIKDKFAAVATNYLDGVCTESDFRCAISYLELLLRRLKKHYKRLAERN